MIPACEGRKQGHTRTFGEVESAFITPVVCAGPGGEFLTCGKDCILRYRPGGGLGIRGGSVWG